MKHLNLFTVIFTLWVFCFASCSQEKTEEQGSHPILKVGDITKTSLSEICTSVEFIPLETSEESLVKTIRKIIFFEDKYFIFDEGQYTIHIFDGEGRFLNKIHSIGLGPGEYIRVCDFNLNEGLKRIELLDPRRQVLSYDLNGNFIESTRLPSPPLGYVSFECTNDSAYTFYSYAFHGEHEHPISHLSSLSAKQNRFNRFKHSDPAVTLFGTHLHKYKNEIYVSEFISDYVYRLIDSSYVVAYEWDFGHRMNDFMKGIKSTPETFNKVMDEYTDLYNSNDENYLRGLSFQSDRHYYTSIIHGKRPSLKNYNPNLKFDFYNVFYERENGKSHYFKRTEEGCEFKVLYMSNDYAMGVIERECIPAIIERKKVENIEVFENWIEDDNPILIKLDFK